MPLSNNEVVEIKKLLTYIPFNELIILSRTITNFCVQIDNDEEATKAIISFTQNPCELLKRRKIKKEYLLTYLFKNDHYNISPQMTKSELIRKVLQLWNTEFDENEIKMEETDESVITPYEFDKYDKISNITNYNSKYSDNESVENFGEVDLFNIWTSWKEFSENEETLEFGNMFCQWYFDLVNKIGDGTIKSMDPSHFFPDVTLLLIHIRDFPEIERQKFCDIGANNVCARLDNIIKQENIKFNPNMTPQGMCCRVDRFGRRMIAICGLMHRNKVVVGLFEQQFVIMRDISSDNNWKAKLMRLAATTQINQPNMLESTCILLK